jgi:hypothetical protein
MITSKVLFDKPEHQVETQQRAEQLLTALSHTLQDVRPGPGSFGDLSTHRGWVEEAVKLKKDLMVSPDDYRIHFSNAGVPFDPAWMTGVATNGRPVDSRNVGSRKVALCLFPALWKHTPAPLEENASIEDALVSHRKFLASPKEWRSFVPKSCIGKATVLVT